MKFEKQMRATAYQTAVEDMKKAGLSPALAYSQGGASHARGASAGQLENPFIAAMTAKQMKAQTQIAQQQAKEAKSTYDARKKFKTHIVEALAPHGSALLNTSKEIRGWKHGSKKSTYNKNYFNN